LTISAITKALHSLLFSHKITPYLEATSQKAELERIMIALTLMMIRLGYLLSIRKAGNFKLNKNTHSMQLILINMSYADLERMT
jgi:hypothetical protein